MQEKVFFRADGNAQIGLGHLVRCIALARMLEDDFSIHFVCKEAPASITEDFVNLGYKYTEIKVEEDFFTLLTGPEIVVLDHYSLDIIYETKIKGMGCKVVCIDDIHNRDFNADVIINQTPGVTAKDYTAAYYTQFALGLDYALLRPEFLSGEKKARLIEFETLFICFGGADAKNITQRALNVVLQQNRFKRIIVVTGASYGHTNELSAILEGSTIVEHHHSVSAKKMWELMSESDVAIVPASGILLETISAGCKIISGLYVDNQKLVFEEYKKADLFISADRFSESDLKYALEKIYADSNSFLKAWVDGKSNIRFLKLFKQLATEEELILRMATKEDIDTTFKWANNKAIRKYFYNLNEISFEEHEKWFLNKIADENCVYLIADFKGERIGSIRFDISNDIAEISYLLVPDYQGKGLGLIILKKGVKTLVEGKGQKIQQLIGKVLVQNKPSQKIFKKMGYIGSQKDKEFKFIKFI